MTEITEEMAAAGRQAAEDWLLYQSGSVHAAIYRAMRTVEAGADAVDAEMLDFTAEHLAAGIAAEEAWRGHQSGSRESAIYQAIRGAMTGEASGVADTVQPQP